MMRYNRKDTAELLMFLYELIPTTNRKKFVQSQLNMVEKESLKYGALIYVYSHANNTFGFQKEVEEKINPKFNKKLRWLQQFQLSNQSNQEKLAAFHSKKTMMKLLCDKDEVQQMKQEQYYTLFLAFIDFTRNYYDHNIGDKQKCADVMV